MVMFRTPGAEVMINAISQFEHPSDFNFKGSTRGSTLSIRVKQNPPQSSQANKPTSPSFV